MAQSRRPRLRDLRQIYLLVGECCELGADPLAWRQHMVESLVRILGGQVAIHTQSAIIAPPSAPGWLRPVFVTDTGWPAISDRKSLERFMAEGKPELAPFVFDMFDPPARLKVFHARGRLGQLGWHEHHFRNEYVRPAQLDDWLHAHHHNDQGQVLWLDVNRARDDRPFGERQRRMLWLFYREITQLLGSRLAKLGEPSVSDLSPRLRDVLLCLLQGDSEKQIALRLGISRHTIHHYVKVLHRRFAASSRGELLARCRVYLPVLQPERRFTTTS